MSDLVGKIVKPMTEVLEKVSSKAPAALEAGHAKIADGLKKAVEHTKATDDALAGTASKSVAAETKAAATADAETAAKDSAESAATSAAKTTAASDAEKAATDKAEADAEKAAAAKAKAEADKAAADKAKVDTSIDGLRNGGGHAPQRHLDPDDAKLQARLGTPKYDATTGDVKLKPNGHVKSEGHVDPATGSTADADNPAKSHYCGPYSTKFDDPADMAKVDDYYAKHIAAHGTPPADPTIEDVLGPDGHKRLTGWYHDPDNPGSYLPVDFEGGTLKGIYKHDPATNTWFNKTMFPSPADGKHP